MTSLTARLPPSVRGLGRGIVEVLPPAAQRRIRASLGVPLPPESPGGPPPSAQRSIPLSTLDAELGEAARLFSVSEDQARAFLDHFGVALPLDAPTDPFSEGYREWTWDIYRQISGRAEYTTENEASPFDLELAIVRPYPYQTGSASVVGGDLAARAHLLRCIGEAVADGVAPPSRLVEFGPGWGNLTNDLVATGFEVTAVEVDHQFCTLLGKRCTTPDNLHVVQSDMLEFDATEPFDAAIFFESFHHCADHLAMLRKLHRTVRRGGVLFFASEPIQGFAYPWGPRLDGLSVWSSRTYGWLELGFDTAYFHEALARTGWRATRRLMGATESANDVFVVRADPAWTG